MRLIFHYVRKHWVLCTTALLFLTIETLSDLLQPTLMSLIVDQGVAKKEIHTILRWGAVMLAVAFAGAIGAIVRNICSSYAAQYIGRDIRFDAYTKVMSLTFEDIDRLQPSAIITRVTSDVTQIQDFARSMLRMMLKAPITCIGAITLIIIQIPSQAPIVAIVLLVSGIFIWLNMTSSFPRFIAVQKTLDHLGTVSREFLRSIRVVKAFGVEAEEQARFNTAASDFSVSDIAATRVNAIYGPLVNLSVNMGIVALLWISRDYNPAHIGALMASMNYMTQVLFALSRVSMILNSSVRASASAKRIGEIFRQTSERTSGSDTKQPSATTQEPMVPSQQTPKTMASECFLGFDHVTFRYPNTARSALTDITIAMGTDSTLGIIGPTGSGKSTLISLIPRFYTPQQGIIRYRGKDLNIWDVNALRSRFALVSQQPILFSGTIRSNLLQGDPRGTQEELEWAIHMSCADEFVDELEEGLDTPIGQNGVNLSGGQKQRISLARALIRKPELLILDDCTSALDSLTERRVLDNLNNVRCSAGPMTIILISQRISTIRHCDQITLMNQGHIMGSGTHEELLATNSNYQSIYDSQIGEGMHSHSHEDDSKWNGTNPHGDAARSANRIRG